MRTHKSDIHHTTYKKIIKKRFVCYSHYIIFGGKDTINFANLQIYLHFYKDFI